MFYLECPEIVDEHIWKPEVVDQLQVDWDHGVLVGGVDLPGEALRDVKPRLSPHHIKIGTELHAVFLK